MTETWDSAGYIASSRYRLAVCEYLVQHGSGLPSRIATETGLAQPHVSRALSELRDRDIVELLVPESQQKGRLYGLTDHGELAYERVASDREAELNIVERGEFPAPELVESLAESYDDDLRAVVWCEPNQTWVNFASSTVSDNYDPETLKAIVSAFKDDEEFGTVLADSPTGGPEFVAFGLEDALVVRIPVESELALLVSVDTDFDGKLRGLIETCRSATQVTALESS
ncbi:transcriptional regulator [Haloferax elongans ATCC BAA-1513]|uniref:Transcriptional regulator n=1 Tax=Haloferax elongans ATCC BAA-1513 TaxID=1230453 RepID=M0HQS2_HALEO|nr:transcriptional regulator [Haloferax elongans]ELZ86042.1 transcriptional regulator [Haloferax elongans ATCC BAA-1513]